MRRRYPVRLTRNFERNLARIEAFLGEPGAARFVGLLEALETRVIPLLENQPAVGRPFLQRSFSPRASALLAAVRARLQAREARELVVEGFLLLYLVSPRSVSLLAVKDQRQLGWSLSPDDEP